jgi:hypothetical protein
LASAVVAGETAGAGRRAVITGLLEMVIATDTTVTAGAGSTVGEAMAVVVAMVVVEEPISRVSE